MVAQPVTDEITYRRSLIIGKVREGLDRIARQYPSANWSVDTPELREATDRLDDSMVSYIQGGELVEVKREFENWERVFLSQPQEGMLFG